MNSRAAQATENGNDEGETKTNARADGPERQETKLTKQENILDDKAKGIP